jgi:hypothetical protein
MGWAIQQLLQQQTLCKSGGNCAKCARIATEVAETAEVPVTQILKLARRFRNFAGLSVRLQFLAQDRYSVFKASKKQDTAPVWQAGPAGSTRISKVSPSQSA